MDDRAAVQRLVHQMNRAAAESYSMIECLFLNVQTGKRRQKSRMNVQYGIGKGTDEYRAQYTHEAGQANQGNVPRAQQIDSRAVEFFARPSRSGNVNRVQPSPAGFIETGRRLPVADDQRDFGVERAGIDAVGDRHEVGTAAG